MKVSEFTNMKVKNKFEIINFSLTFEYFLISDAIKVSIVSRKNVDNI